ARLARIAMERGEGISPHVAVALLVEVLYGLQAAHEATNEHGERLGIVHRDVSPQNVLVGTDGVARVVDFGVAKAIGRAHTTRGGQVKGKLPYMAPEQLRGTALDARADVYSAAVVLWETLAGRRLFEGETEGAIVGMVLETAVAPPSRHAPHVPKAVDDVVL